MIEPIEGAPAGVLAFKAVGKVEAAEQVLTPGIDMATAGGGKVRLVYELGAEYDEYSVGATWREKNRLMEKGTLSRAAQPKP